MLDERFPGPGLDAAVWLPAYLPAWSSRAAAAATWRIDGEGLHLTVPEDQPLWCPGLHDPPLKVSAVQSGNRSGPVGSTLGQQPFRPGMVVQEAQPTLVGMVRRLGRVEVECRATIAADSMFSAWMIGMEDEPDRCGELCLVEVFGDAPAEIGCGVKAIRDPRLVQEFGTQDLGIDVADWHRYAVEWREDGVDFLVDGEVVRSTTQSPDYPMLLIIGVFEFPGRAERTGDPELVVRRVTGG